MTQRLPVTDPALDRLADELRSWAFTFSQETDLHDGIQSVIEQTGWGFEREAKIGNGRIDFIVRVGKGFVLGHVGIEVKVDGSIPQVAAQLQRYLQSGRIDSLLLVTTKPAHAALPREIAGRAVSVLVVAGGLS